jgi:hypothetical protein
MDRFSIRNSVIQSIEKNDHHSFKRLLLNNDIDIDEFILTSKDNQKIIYCPYINEYLTIPQFIETLDDILMVNEDDSSQESSYEYAPTSPHRSLTDPI